MPTDDELVKRAVDARTRGLRSDLFLKAMVADDCEACRERCARLMERVNATPEPAYTLAQIQTMLAEGSLKSYEFTPPDKLKLEMTNSILAVHGRLKPDPCPRCGGNHDPYSEHPHENELCVPVPPNKGGDGECTSSGK